MPGPTEYHITRNIDEHVGLIARQVERSLRDAETRRLAVKIVSNKATWRMDPAAGKDMPFVDAWGQWFRLPVQRNACPPREDDCEVIAIWNFVVANCRYVYDPTDIDMFVTTEETLKMGGSDCDDFTIVFASLLKAVGFQARARVISTTEAPDDWAHIYPLVGLPKDKPRQWMPLDATVKGARPGWEYQSIALQRDYRL